MNRYVAALAACLSCLPALAQPRGEPTTVCTITVNSADERDVYRRHLPQGSYRFVELVERGRPDWLGASCRSEVRCDVLMVSGHFAGTEFYSSRFNVQETLPIDEIERAACSESCPGLFSQLKEVYLFGCDTLNPAPVRGVTPEVLAALERAGASPEQARVAAQMLAQRHGGSALEQMRRLFTGVPVIYGFSSKAPYGRVAGPMLEGLFRGGYGEPVGAGRVNVRLARLFAPTSMTVTSGLAAHEPNADFRAEACRYHDQRTNAAAKLASIHALLSRSMAEARLSLERIEKFLAGVDEAARREPAFGAAMAAIAADAATRARYVALVRDTPDPAVRVRLIALARGLGWFGPDDERGEVMRMVGDLLSARSAGFGEVDLICTLNRDGGLDREVGRLQGLSTKSSRAADAALACLGSEEGRARVLAALASRDENDVQIAQAYLRHRPITDGPELRAVALAVASMEGSAAQARALETLARHHIADAEVLDRLARVYTSTRSPAVQRAIAEVYIRAGYRGSGDLARTLERHRVRSGEGSDVIDALIARLRS